MPESTGIRAHTALYFLSRYLQSQWVALSVKCETSEPLSIVRQSATQLPAHQNSLLAASGIPRCCLSPGTAQRQRNPEVKRFIRPTPLFSQHL
jgi:hypothetical protein